MVESANWAEAPLKVMSPLALVGHGWRTTIHLRPSVAPFPVTVASVSLLHLFLDIVPSGAFVDLWKYLLTITWLW